MRAVQVSKANGPFEIVERDIPEPDGAQVRIKVQACGVCHGDSVTKEGYFLIYSTQGFSAMRLQGLLI